MIRIGVDFGGTKIEAAALSPEGEYVARVRQPNPGDYAAALEAVTAVVREAASQAGVTVQRVGVGIPGSISPRTGMVRNANSVWMNGLPFHKDLARVSGLQVRVANDANCLVLSEAVDGAAKGARVVFGAILGTGTGGGVVVDGQIIEGHNGVGGEWGHTPLPWPDQTEHQAHRCWCGRVDCLETWVSGTAFREDYERATGNKPDGVKIIEAMRAGEPEAVAAFDRYVDRLGRALAVMTDFLDPDVVVLGGGMSNTDELYARLPEAIGRHVFSDLYETPIRKAEHGDSSGVRGAAWLWPLQG